MGGGEFLTPLILHFKEHHFPVSNNLKSLKYYSLKKSLFTSVCLLITNFKHLDRFASNFDGENSLKRNVYSLTNLKNKNKTI